MSNQTPPAERRFCNKINDYSEQRIVLNPARYGTSFFPAKSGGPTYECLSPAESAFCRICYINSNIKWQS